MENNVIVNQSTTTVSPRQKPLPNFSMSDLMSARRKEDESINEYTSHVTMLVERLNPSCAISNESFEAARAKRHNRDNERKNYRKDWKKDFQNDFNKKWCSFCKKNTHQTSDCRNLTEPKKPILTMDGQRQFIEAKIDGKPTYVLVDNGSGTSILPKSYGTDVSRPTNFTSADDHPIEIDGLKDVNISFDNLNANVNIFVGQVTTPILGRNFLDHFECSILYNDKLSYSFNGKRYFKDLLLEAEVLKRKELNVTANHICTISTKDLTISNRDDGPIKPIGDNQELMRLIDEYNDVFNGIGRTNLIEHTIDTVSSQPISSKPCDSSYVNVEDVQTLIKEMIKDKVLSESSSAWCHPLVVNKKEHEGISITVDYKKLNDISKFDASPAPKVLDVARKIGNAKYFSKIYFFKGHFQIPIRSEDQQKTAFQFSGKTYEFKTMPAELDVSTQTFARLTIKMFNFDFTEAHADAVCIYSSTTEEHLQHLALVFKTVKKTGMTLNLSKCNFFLNQINFLNFKISNSRIEPVEEKIEAIVKFLAPTDKSKVRSFLGLISQYRQLISEFAEYSMPLHELLETKERFLWTECHQEAFEKLKTVLTSRPGVSTPNDNTDLVVKTDASYSTMSGVLFQVEAGEYIIIEHFSKLFNKHQRKYSTTEKEATALVTVIEHWSPILMGGTFKLETDDELVTWIQSMANKSGKLGRMALQLAKFTFTTMPTMSLDQNGAQGRLPRNK